MLNLCLIINSPRVNLPFEIDQVIDEYVTPNNNHKKNYFII